MTSFVRTILTEYLRGENYALMDFADSDVVFDSEVMVELDNIATTRGSVARELIVEQDDENKIRAIVQQNVEEIKVSIQRHGIDKERIRLLVKGNDERVHVTPRVH